MRRAIALLITLTVIAALLALMGVAFSYLEKAKKDSLHSSAIIQANIYYADIGRTLDQLLKGKNASDILSVLYLAPQTIQEKEGNFFVSIGCEPLSNGVDINWFGLQNDKKNQKKYNIVTKLFDKISSEYNLEDDYKLLEFIMEDIEGKNESIRLKQKKGILSSKQFNTILNRYFVETGDTKVFNVPWSRYFTFVSPSSNVDSKYISSELIAMLFDLDINSVKEEWIEGEDLVKFLNDFGANMEMYDKAIYSNTLLKRMRCTASYSYNSGVYSFSFNYLDGKAEYFEFYSKQ
ncbi:MAG: hypothetical protein JXQ76_08645 [Campylobacterales bacterium]|nr:hypothetical protein [Campylobacterales bacterium]